MKSVISACCCGSGRRYADCCGQLHSGAKTALTAEVLMQSRYSAYVLALKPYLQATWHASTRPAALDLGDETATKWLGLTVKRHQVLDDSHASVEFVARYRVAGRGQRLHETSRFVREDGVWYYLNGEFAGAADSAS